MSIYTACAPTRSLFLLRLVRLQLSSCIAIYAEFVTAVLFITTIALVQSLLNSSIICPALVDITAFVDITFFALPANMRRRQSRCQSRRQSVDSSSDEYELTDSETEYHSGSETEPTDVDDDVDEVIEDVQDVDGQLTAHTFLLMKSTHQNIISNRWKSSTSRSSQRRTTAMAPPVCLIGSKNSGVSKQPRLFPYIRILDRMLT